MAILPRFADEWLLSRILEATGSAPVRLLVKGGADVSPPGGAPVATMVIQDRSTLAGLLRDPEVSFGDAYMDGRIEVEGDLVRFLEAIYQAMENSPAPASGIPGLASKWMDLSQDNSRHGSRNNIHRHYDLGNDFYKLWLDEQLLYTCAYFPDAFVDIGARANRQDGSRLPQAAVAARRDGGGSGLRLGSAGASHGSRVWRVGESLQRFS